MAAAAGRASGRIAAIHGALRRALLPPQARGRAAARGRHAARPDPRTWKCGSWATARVRRRCARCRASCVSDTTVTWLGDVSRARARRRVPARHRLLPPERAGRLRHRAAGSDGRRKPIVAARAAAIPEVAPHAALFEPDRPEALAAAIEALYRSPDARSRQSLAGAAGWSSSMRLVAARFLDAAAGARVASASAKS